MNFDEAYKNKIGAQLTRKLGQALKDQKIKIEGARMVTSYILDNIDNITNHSQLIEFLTRLYEKWPFYSDILTLEKGKKLEEKKEEEAKEVTKLIKENKIEEAIETAESATNKKREGES